MFRGSYGSTSNYSAKNRIVSCCWFLTRWWEASRIYFCYTTCRWPVQLLFCSEIGPVTSTSFCRQFSVAVMAQALGIYTSTYSSVVVLFAFFRHSATLFELKIACIFSTCAEALYLLSSAYSSFPIRLSFVRPAAPFRESFGRFFLVSKSDNENS